MEEKKQIEIDGIVYEIRILNTFYDKIYLSDNGVSMRSMVDLGVKRVDNEIIDWKTISKENGEKIWDELVKLNSKDFRNASQNK